MLARFKGSWPRDFKKDGISSDGKVDPTLYLASLLPSVYVGRHVLILTHSNTSSRSMILLHDPHADMTADHCPSAKRIYEAVAVIMESIYKLTSTYVDALVYQLLAPMLNTARSSYDVTLLDHYSSVSLLPVASSDKFL